MQQKWGSTVKNYAAEKGISKKNFKKIKKQNKKIKNKRKNQVLVFLII